MAWAGSTRRARLPKGWSSSTVPRIKARDNGVCQWPGEDGVCGQVGTEVDHRVRGDDHADTNLWLLCHHHHAAKTAREAAAARGPGVSEHRPAERHPGLT